MYGGPAHRPVKLDVTESDAGLLHETIQQFQWAANYVVQYAHTDGGYVETSKGKLNSRTYDDVRRETDLHSNLVQAARSRAAEALKSVVAKWKRGKKASLPHFTSPFLEYDKRSATFHDGHASLSTVGGRITAEYVLPDEDRDTPHSSYLFSDDYETTGATLHYREPTGEFYLHVRTKADVDAPEPRENGTVLGVDLGVENIAVTSTGVFWSGKELDHWRREYEKRRASLQQCGSRYAHENVQAVGRKETGRFEQLLHRVANELVDEADERGCSHIAFEDLTDIRERMPGAKRLHAWAFQRLFSSVEYKAKRRGIAVRQVNPANTSRRCSSCGFTHEDNRSSQDSFECLKCGYANHADYNAVVRRSLTGSKREAFATAKNIGYRLLRNQNGGKGGAPVGVRLNSAGPKVPRTMRTGAQRP